MTLIELSGFLFLRFLSCTNEPYFLKGSAGVLWELGFVRVPSVKTGRPEWSCSCILARSYSSKSVCRERLSLSFSLYAQIFDCNS